MKKPTMTATVGGVERRRTSKVRKDAACLRRGELGEGLASSSASFSWLKSGASGVSRRYGKRTAHCAGIAG